MTLCILCYQTWPSVRTSNFFHGTVNIWWLQDKELSIVVDQQPIVINCATNDKEEYAPLNVSALLTVALVLYKPKCKFMLLYMCIWLQLLDYLPFQFFILYFPGNTLGQNNYTIVLIVGFSLQQIAQPGRLHNEQKRCSSNTQYPQF